MPSLPRGQTKSPFPLKYPHELSFIAMQRIAQEEADKPVGPIKTMVQYKAKDSIVFDIQQKTLHLYGVGGIDYEDIKLEAENIALDWSTNNITATGKQNEAGEIEKKTVFTQGAVQYIAEEICYNFDSKRGTARRLFTKQDEAIIQCDKAKMDTEDTYYTDCIKYTTCNLVKPHYYIKARKVKFIQDKQVASGPFQFYFDDVPTPLGFFYGFFFIPRPKTSGILPPKLGEDAQKGFFMRDGGYYCYFNDYLDLALQGTLYSKGASSLSAKSTYKKRYGYTGGVSYERTSDTRPDELALQQDIDKGWRFQWQHNTENNRVSSLAAEVDLQGQSSNKKNSPQPGKEGLNATTNSRIRYTHKLVGLPYVLSTSLVYSKNFQTKVTNLTLPQASLSTSHIYPFRRQGSAAGRWYTDIYFKHSFEFKNQLSNMIGKDTLEISRQNLPRLWKESRYGAKHTLPLVTNIKIFNYFNLKPSFQYQERWYFRSLDYKYDAGQDTIVADTIAGFRRVWDYSLGVGLQTTLYGTHFFSPDAAIQAIRHQLEPAVGFTYTPDFYKERLGYWQKVQTKQGEKRMNRFNNCVYGAPGNRASAVMDLKVDNKLNMKVRNSTDPAGHAKKVPILEALSLSTSYDFLADSFKLSDIKLEARTRVLDSLVSIEYSTTFDPYIYEQQQRVEEFAWHHGQGLGHVKQSTLKLGISLKPPGSSQPGADEFSPAKQLHEPLPVDSTLYVDFNVPWGLKLAYYRNYTYDIKADKKAVIRQLSFDGEISLTKKWKVAFSSTYDIDKKELVGKVTKLGIYRDFHCWQMNFDWHPLGKKQSYEFSIGLKAPTLQDIKYDRSNEYVKF